jgi:hypothetical protein
LSCIKTGCSGEYSSLVYVIMQSLPLSAFWREPYECRDPCVHLISKRLWLRPCIPLYVYVLTQTLWPYANTIAVLALYKRDGLFSSLFAFRRDVTVLVLIGSMVGRASCILSITRSSTRLCFLTLISTTNSKLTTNLSTIQIYSVSFCLSRALQIHLH